MDNYRYRLFGRSKGRGKNTKISNDAIKLQVKKVDPFKYNIIDIGAGYGESSTFIAKINKKSEIIVCEKFLDGINKIAEKTNYEGLKNISIFHGNVIQFFDELVVSNSITEIWILFPDPWPKKRHNKRRLINKKFFIYIKNFLKRNAIIHIASDSKAYISEILMCIYEVRNDFLWVNQNKHEWDYLNLSLPKTKYLEKALKNGLNPIYLKLVKL